MTSRHGLIMSLDAELPTQSLDDALYCTVSASSDVIELYTAN